jgi:hypothetical protein
MREKRKNGEMNSGKILRLTTLRNPRLSYKPSKNFLPVKPLRIPKRIHVKFYQNLRKREEDPKQCCAIEDTFQ